MKRKILGTLLIGIAALSLTACSSNSNDVKKVDKATTTSTSKEEKEKEQEFKIGETASYKGYEVTVNKVEFNDGSEFNKPADGKQFVIVNVTIKNNTDKPASYNMFDYKLNADGNSTDMIGYIDGYESLGSGELDKGASVSGNLIGEANTQGSLKLQYHSNVFSDKTIVFNLK